jgi:photosystem II stability/assembly factor-like uncharacterized protein
MDFDFDPASSRSHVRRAASLIAVSLTVIVCTGILYLSPSLPSLIPSRSAAMPPVQASYRVGAVDFVNPRVGWVVALLAAGDIALLHTTDGGATWARQLLVAGDVHPTYVKFFDQRVGIFALLGVRPLLYTTEDGGESWVERSALGDGTSVISWSFVDSDHGWMLAHGEGSAAATPLRLYRTQDGGRTWDDLGPPVAPPAQAYQVHFSYLTTGWLATSGPQAVAYKSIDFGATWKAVALPPPAAGWAPEGQYFVGVQPTLGAGALASVVFFPPIKGRTGVGGSIRAFPPLTVRSFDGGRPYTYLYTTVLDRLVAGGRSGAPPPNETILTTIDNGASWRFVSQLPQGGALGYSDASDWWWVGPGAWKGSTDGGVTWGQVLPIDVDDPVPGLLQVLDGRHAWMVALAESQPVLQTTDDALHWRTVALPAVALPTTQNPYALETPTETSTR